MPKMIWHDLTTWVLPAEAARRLHVSRQRLYQLIEEGSLIVAALPTHDGNEVRYLVSPISLQRRLDALARGEIGPLERRYRTTRRNVCSHVISSDDDVYENGRCKRCQQARVARYHEAHRDARLVQMREYDRETKRRVAP